MMSLRTIAVNTCRNRWKHLRADRRSTGLVSGCYPPLVIQPPRFILGWATIPRGASRNRTNAVAAPTRPSTRKVVRHIAVTVARAREGSALGDDRLIDVGHVRELVVGNATPYSDDEKFLAGSTQRTQAV